MRVAGVDVGGERKGFHVAVVDAESARVVDVRACLRVADAVAWLGQTGVSVVAIDAPPRALRTRLETRVAERALFRLGYRIQWTRQSGSVPAAEWMIQGQLLWEELRAALPECTLIETFPTAASDRLDTSEVQLPLAALAGREKRAEMKDFVDAVICVHVALKFAKGEAEPFGEEDELGPIYL